MNLNGKLLLCRMWEKKSARGNVYFAGRLGAASLVMFKDEYAEGPEPCWQVFIQEPRQPEGANQLPNRSATQPVAGKKPDAKPKARRKRGQGKTARAAAVAGDWHPPDKSPL